MVIDLSWRSRLKVPYFTTGKAAPPGCTWFLGENIFLFFLLALGTDGGGGKK